MIDTETSSPVAGNKRDHKEEGEKEETNENNADEEDVVTLLDVLKQNEHMTETADAVLGDASDTYCSYPMGYIRQAIYACMTCTPDALEKSETRAGVCLACTYKCHQDHELVELYTKRAFRCDCGNEKFPKTNPCQLEVAKTSTNSRNTYSQNYGGVYCNCHRPYPDPERTTMEIMVQCIICEDWLHEEHIFKDVVKTRESQTAEKDALVLTKTGKELSTNGAVDKATDCKDSLVPANYDELICFDCMKKHPFLMAYTVNNCDVEGKEGEETIAGGDSDASKVKQSDKNECVLKKKQQQLEAKGSTTLQPTFWSSEWRNDLCQCSSCTTLLEKHGIPFLLDPDDALHVYEASAREKKTASDEEVAQRAFAKTLTHEQQVEVAMGYSLMKTNLQQYLANFATEGKTVRKEDITDFFKRLSQTKRQKIE
ncbi:unnamed protein product [Peronospora effusa]|uniref:UBR-type domain-containing protein n=1 Tax=Peronospora effusa TaxID=542832 RepID=A0A3M6VJ20_9STRA|nr:hypothetical protein DD238_003734 [Peronospora effusa]RQM15952.1 hypothetical protein DD237_004219 [Peronospora effusa]CAI5700617.1 unnamed protein product [Peronospora effusa]